MQRFFVLGEHSLCSVNDQPDIAPFLNGSLAHPLTVLAVQHASPYLPKQVIQPTGYPLLRQATIDDARFYFTGLPVSDELLSAIEAQDRETEQTVEALSALAPSLRESMDGARKRFAQCIKEAAVLPSPYKMEMDARELLSKATTQSVLAAEMIAAQDLPHASMIDHSTLFDAIRQAIVGVLATPLGEDVPYLAPALMKEAVAAQEIESCVSPTDMTPAISHALLSCHEHIVDYYKVMSRMYQQNEQIAALAKEATELHQTMLQSRYNYWALDRMLMAGGQTHNAVSNNPAPFDWESIEADAYHVQSLARLSQQVLDGLVKQFHDFNAKLAWSESNIPAIS